MGRQDKKRELEHRITFRLGQKELERLDAMLARSNCQSQSELIRKMLFKGEITVMTHDRSLDIIMEILSGIRTELHAIGININQVTRRFHQEKQPEARLLKALKIQELNKETGEKVDEVLALIGKLSGKWLQE
ncbi:MAG: hypothetical protein BGO31_20625 [Bacteroidetes bacterium 43-16]|uniref:plasmid mobilization protein n=1 Tax=uncultured Dysgonomonas sp. TaxID=206096 RepID=UPI000926D37F|nr:ribbon-helix-helix protein, CopG family [uncultured Dysgonomonas sp.]OJV55383.1 MAG: hypothetical protein BGO31_20625 [Bacteroidetes bacterium 43-16]